MEEQGDGPGWAGAGPGAGSREWRGSGTGRTEEPAPPLGCRAAVSSPSRVSLAQPSLTLCHSDPRRPCLSELHPGVKQGCLRVRGRARTPSLGPWPPLPSRGAVVDRASHSLGFWVMQALCPVLGTSLTHHEFPELPLLRRGSSYLHPHSNKPRRSAPRFARATVPRRSPCALSYSLGVLDPVEPRWPPPTGSLSPSCTIL